MGRAQQLGMVALRFVIGWHLFFQGVGKLRAPQWTAEGYLKAAQGLFAGGFHALAQNATLLKWVDAITVWALIVLGLLLMLGLFSQWACLAGGMLVLSFYLAAPALTHSGFLVTTVEGTEFYVNKTLLEALALLLLSLFPTGRMAGLDVLFHRLVRRTTS